MTRVGKKRQTRQRGQETGKKKKERNRRKGKKEKNKRTLQKRFFKRRGDQFLSASLS